MDAVEAGEEVLAMNEELDARVLETQRRGDELLCWHMLAAKACVSLDQIKNYWRCDEDSKLLTAADADIGLEIVAKVLNLKSDNSGRAEVIVVA